MLAWMVEEKGIEPHVPVGRRLSAIMECSAHRTSSSINLNTLTCPGGKRLQHNGATWHETGAACHQGQHRNLSASQVGLRVVRAQAEMLSRSAWRKVVRIVHEASPRGRQVFQEKRPNICSHIATEKYRDAIRPFEAHAELDRLRLRGPTGAHGRICAGCSRAKPSQACEALIRSAAVGDKGCMRKTALPLNR